MKGYVNAGQKNQQCLHCRKVLRKGEVGMKHPESYGRGILVWHRDCLLKLINQAPLSEPEVVTTYNDLYAQIGDLLFTDEVVSVV